MKKCIFFPIMGDYDKLKKPNHITSGWDYICFTNNPKLKSKFFKIIHVKDKEGLGDSRFARKIWINNHRYVGDYDLSISIGGQIKVMGNLNKFVKKYLPKDDSIDMAMATHPSRKCIYEEAKKCIAVKKDKKKSIDRQMKRYRAEGYPEDNGLSACGIIVRKHGRSNVERHCDLWWDEVKNNSLRDQLSFNYILWKYNLVNINYFDYKVIIGSKDNFFKRCTHKGKTKF